jgi:hypothetical protein
VAVGEAILHKKALFCRGGPWAVTEEAAQTMISPETRETRSRRSGRGSADGAACVIFLLDVELQPSARRARVGLSHQDQANVHRIGIGGVWQDRIAEHLKGEK